MTKLYILYYNEIILEYTSSNTATIYHAQYYYQNKSRQTPL